MQLVGERRMQLSLISEVMMEAISGDQFHSVVISGNLWQSVTISANQCQSEAIGGNQRRSPGRARSTRAPYLNGSP